MLKIDMEYRKGVLYVRLDGSLKRKVCYKINNYIVPIILKHKIKYLVFNLKDLIDIDTSGLDAILNLKCAIRTNKGKMCLCGLNNNTKEKFKRLRIRLASNELAAGRLIHI